MSAVLSPCGSYRYRLERSVGGLLCHSRRVAAVIMVNPSTADHALDDQTIRKLYGFMERANFGRFIVGNLFAWRATDVRDLRTAPDPVGPDNDAHLREITRAADAIVVAWGASGKLPRDLRDRWRPVVEIARAASHGLTDRPILCLGTAADGHPLHPLTLGYARQLTPWTAP